MRRLILLGTVLAAAAAGCGDEESAPDVPAEIARSIAGHCKQEPVETEFKGDRAHAEYAGRADEYMLIRCPSAPATGVNANRSAYAKFENVEALDQAIASIALPPAYAEGYCIVGDQAFTTEFWGSDPTCKEVDGELKGVREPPVPSAVNHHTYTSNSGNAFSLVHRPIGWSSGGTAGADNMHDLTWRRWTETSALGVGTVGLRGPCVTGANGPECKGQNAYYQAPGRVFLDQPRSCKDQGVTIRYFSRARFQFYARADNPFGEPVGWVERVHPLEAYKGKCQVSGGSGLAASLPRAQAG